jgi:hypothetical protein
MNEEENRKYAKIAIGLFLFAGILQIIIAFFNKFSLSNIVLAAVFFLNAYIQWKYQKKTLEEQWAAWEKVRRKGMWYWIIVYGIILFGGTSTMLIWTIGEVNTLGALLNKWWIALFGGLFFGVTMWFSNEKQYEKYMEQKKC